MLGAVAHRNVDGVWRDELDGAVLGFGLRATTARQRACRQPIFVDRSSRIAAVCDARLDNLDDLHRELGLEGGPVSDAELIARAYERWDLDAVVRLRGDFAFALFDRARRRILAARSPFGIRGLHYRSTGPVFALATEPTQLLQDPDTPKEVDSLAVLDHLTGEYAHHRPTFFRAIARVEPGHVLVATSDRQTQLRYWYPPTKELPPAPVVEFASEFGRLFRQSVRARMASPSPTTMHLSGGLDSSSIVAVAVDELRRHPSLTPSLTALGATFPGLDCDESSYIETVRAHTGVSLQTWNGVSESRSSDELLVVDPATPYGRPLGIGNGPPGDLETARALGARVLLTGEGGNHVSEETNFVETLIGQRRWRGLAVHLFGTRVPGEPPRARIQRGVGLLMRHRLMVPSRLRDAFDCYLDKEKWERRPVPDWIGPALRALWPGPHPDSLQSKAHWASRRQKAVWSQVSDARATWNLDYHDQVAARYGVEVRFPFLDVDLVTFVLSLPESVVGETEDPRGMHKAAMRGVVPRSVLDRRTGATFDNAHMHNFRKALPAIRAAILAPDWWAGDYVLQSAARRLLDDVTRAGTGSVAWTTVTLLRNIAALEIWLRAI